MMPPAPGITQRKHNQEGSVTNSGNKSAEVIRHELESVAMDICVNHEEDESFEADVDDTDEEKTENDNQTAGSSPVSATSSTKENVVPESGRKKAKAVRRLIMTYSPKRKRTKQHASGGSTRHRRNSSRSTSVASSCVGEAKTANEDVKVKIEITDEKSDHESSDDDGDETRGEGVYVVERIDGKQVVEGVTYYFIKWKGWDESANTWEPIEHLDGCSELLDAFSKREAEKRSHKRRAGSKNGRRDDSDEEDEDGISETQQNMRSYGILTEWPADKEPISVEGAISVDGALTYVVKRRARLGSRQLDRTNTILVHADGFREKYPQLVIAFYQSRVLWCEPDNQKTESEKAAAAAQVSLLAQHRGVKQEADMTNDINSDMQMDCEVSDENELPATEGSSKTMTFGLEHDTQVIPTDEEDAIDTNPPSDDSDDNDIAQPNLLERIIKTEVDKFGLPEDLEDDVSTDSEAEFVESPSKNCMNSINTSIGNTKPVTLF